MRQSCAILFVLMPAVFAGAQGTAPNKITAKTVLALYVEALGGQNTLDKIQTVHEKRELIIDGMSHYPVQFDLYGTSDGRYFTDTRSKVQEIRIGYDGTRYWAQGLYNGHAQPVHFPDDEAPRFYGESTGYLYAMIDRLKEAEVVGAAMVGEKKAVVLKWTSSQGRASLYYFDLRSGLLIQTVHPTVYRQFGALGEQVKGVHDNQFGFVETCLYRDYEKAPGTDALFSSHIECEARGTTVSSRLLGIEINPPTNDRIFSEPR